MKYVPNIVAGLLGFAFIAFSVMFLFKLVPDQPQPPAGSPIALFMGAFIPTGYMHFVKVFELLGGFMVAIPRTRNIGLLFLGPVILNIIAFHVFVAKDALSDVSLPIIGLMALYLLWVERKAFAGLVTRNPIP